MASELVNIERMQELYKDLLPAMLKFYNETGYQLNDNELFLQICLRFGEAMIPRVCDVLNVELGECVIAAMALVKLGG